MIQKPISHLWIITLCASKEHKNRSKSSPFTDLVQQYYFESWTFLGKQGCQSFKKQPKLITGRFFSNLKITEISVLISISISVQAEPRSESNGLFANHQTTCFLLSVKMNSLHFWKKKRLRTEWSQDATLSIKFCIQEMQFQIVLLQWSQQIREIPNDAVVMNGKNGIQTSLAPKDTYKSA